MNKRGSGLQSTGQRTPGLNRRAFLYTGAGVFATFAAVRAWPFGHAAVGAGMPAEVTVVDFDASGKPTGTIKVPSVVKTDAEWKAKLSPISYDVARRAGTERPFTGSSYDEHARGLFRCICCDLALFKSDTKFDSGTGWPSFWQPIAKQNVVERTDMTLGMARTSVSCRQCDAHLGHVFDDGPRPTGLRYCMNSASMRFMKTA